MENTEKKEATLAAQALLATAMTGALGTINKDASPLVTLVALATMANGTPLLLLSNIAAHTQNILREPRVSLLIDGDPTDTDPMTAPRLSVSGRVARLSSADIGRAKPLFIQKHPGSDPYDREVDFNYYKLEIEGARFNQGFGRFRKLGRDDLLNTI